MSASSGEVRVSAAVDEVRSRIVKRTARVGVIGLGYVGLPLALRLSEERFPVTGFDIDQEKVRILSEGGSYIHRIPRAQVQAALDQGFSTTGDFAQIGDMDVVLICVPTPLTSTREPDLSYIRATAEAVASHVHAGQLIVLESTTYPGTTEEFLVPILEQNPAGLRVSRSGMTGNNVFFVAFSPEREDPGNETVARRSIPKVVGGVDEAATRLAAELYGGLFDSVVQVSSAAAAEMTKLLENIYRCVNIALVNELKLLCLRMGIDIWEVIAAAATKPFGFQPFYPGPGLGGHCIPVDPFYLSWRARQYDFQTKFIELAGDVNTAMPYHVVESVSRALNEHKKALKGSRILILGMAYKKDVDDLRESPALAIIELLRQHGAEVSYNDPYFPKVTEGRRYSLHMNSVPLEKLGQYDCVVIVTDHSDYDYTRIVRESKLVVDTRNATRGIQGSNIVRC